MAQLVKCLPWSDNDTIYILHFLGKTFQKGCLLQVFCTF